MPFSALKPARINSLFLTPTPSVKARFFISPICSSSVLGMVKLSRTTLTFLSFKGLAGLGAGLVTLGWVLVADGNFAAGLAFLTAVGLTAGLETGFVAGFVAGLEGVLPAELPKVLTSGFTATGRATCFLGAVLLGAVIFLATWAPVLGLAWAELA